VAVTELLPGGEVYQRICSIGKFSEVNASFIIKSMANAFAQLHQAHLINPDFKLENVVFTDPTGWECKMIDMGLVQELARNNEFQYVRASKAQPTHLGTPSVLAPESVQRNVYSPASDMYQLGCFLFYILLAEPLPKSSLEIAATVRESDRSEPAKSLLLRLLSEDPKKRPLALDVLADRFVVNPNDLPDTPLGKEYIERVRMLQARKPFRSFLKTVMERANAVKSKVSELVGLNLQVDSLEFGQVRQAFVELSGADVDKVATRANLKDILTRCSLAAFASDQVLEILDPQGQGLGYNDLMMALTAFRGEDLTTRFFFEIVSRLSFVFRRLLLLTLPLQPLTTPPPAPLSQQLDRDSSNSLSREEVVHVLSVFFAHYGQAVEEDAVEALFSCMDKDSDGAVDREELENFIKAMRAASSTTGEYAYPQCSISGVYR